MSDQHALTLAQSNPPETSPELKVSERMGGIVTVCIGLIIVAVVVDKLRKKKSK
ncbi:MAG TPA: hypothetical protein VEB22_05255 [Phycisphaerales bacterium]|nr:hypothetical protein [Phycisphaerales bacterium]